MLCPSFTFAATAEAVALLGRDAGLRRCRSPRPSILTPAGLEAAIEAAKAAGPDGPLAVIPVDLFGLPADYDAIEPLAQRHGLWVLADAAQSLAPAIGSVACRQRSATVTATSFFPAKPLGCYGDGGAIFTDDDDSAARMREHPAARQGASRQIRQSCASA